MKPIETLLAKCPTCTKEAEFRYWHSGKAGFSEDSPIVILYTCMMCGSVHEYKEIIEFRSGKNEDKN